MTADEIDNQIAAFIKAEKWVLMLAKKRFFYPLVMCGMSIVIFAIAFIHEIYNFGNCRIWGACSYIYNFSFHVVDSILFGSVLGLIGAPLSHYFFKKKQINPRLAFIESEIKSLQKAKSDIESKLLREAENAEWQRQLDREIAREKALGQAKNENVLQAIKDQIMIMHTYREKGLDVERQIMEMRKELLELEGQENEAMLNQLKTALDSMDSPIAVPQVSRV